MNLIIIVSTLLLGGIMFVWKPVLFLGLLFLAVLRFLRLGGRLTRGTAFIIIAAGVLGGLLQTYYASEPSPPHIQWGVTFSAPMSENLKLNPDEVYRAIVEDLRPHTIRLGAYWNRIEPQRGVWNFSELDRYIEQARIAHIPIILAVGQKVPRWPECHLPDFTQDFFDANFEFANEEARAAYEDALLQYLTRVIERYRTLPHLLYWQIENEPLFDFGECPSPDRRLLGKELALAKRLDPFHPLLLTTSGELGSWYEEALQGDRLGTTLYTRVFNRLFGQIAYPLTPEFYALKRSFVSTITRNPRDRFIVAELGAEPWGRKQIYEMTLEEQRQLFSPFDFKETINYARRTAFDSFSFWGVEWWYDARERGMPDYWNEAQRLFAT